MEYRRLGRTDLTVSALSYGLMTFGEQNTEAEGHALMDQAADAGVNFFDVAELYPIPPRAETQGETERILGSWMQARGNRDRCIVATKVVGAGGPAHFRNGAARLDRANLTEALHRSLRNLNTDYVDVYYTHWPNRSVNIFGRRGYVHTPEADGPPIEEAWETMNDFIKTGLVRHAAISNETPWGLAQHLRLAETKALPRPVCIQNCYHLMNRLFEAGLAEMAIREDCGLCAYSVLAMGLLSGKYQQGARPDGARLTLFPERFARYIDPKLQPIVEAYLTIAAERNLDPAALAIAFAARRPFTTSVILGATTPEQLGRNLTALDIPMDDDLLTAIEAVHRTHPNPVP